MAYTWTNKTKTGGVGLTGKIVQKGKDDFPLMYANDLDWANVEVENGVNLNTTDDLLDYIKGGTSAIIGRIDELELSNAGYEIRCDKSVCYVGDTLSRVPVLVYKNNTALTWSQIQTEGITLKTPVTKPTGGNDLISFTSNGQWLNGIANVAGTYIFEFMKNGVCIASFRLLVLLPTYRSVVVMAYVKSSTMPQTPTGGSYDFANDVLTTPPTSTNPSLTWSASPDNLSGTGPIWFSSGSVNEANPNTILWNAPCMLLTEEIVMQEADYRVKEIAIYKAVKSTASAPSAPSGANAGSYSFSANNGNGSFTCPTGWSLEPNAAVTAYKSSAATEDKDNYKIWKSYNSYQCTVSTDTPPVYGTVTESGWTTPVVYLDIDGILNDADTRAQATFDAALGSASTDLQRAAELIENTQPLIDAVNAIFAWRIVGDGANALDSKYTELVDTNGTDTDMDDLHDLFDGYYSSSNNRYEGTIAALNANPNICISAMEFKAIKFGSITDLNSSTAVTNKWVAYIPTTTEIRTQIASLSDDLSQLNTTVNQQTPEWIRLQASKGFLDNVTWTMVPEAEYTSATNKIDLGSAALPTTEYVASTNTSGYRYGYYYKRTESGVSYWYRCDYPISTGFANILADRVSFGVATNNLNSGDSVKGALIDMTVDGVSITGRKIVLNGDTVANAIYGKSLNVNNTTYLCADGDVYFGVSNTIDPDAVNKSGLNTGSGSSRFNHNGSGQLAGGNISWTGNGSIYMKAAYIGSFGDGHNWTIKSLSDQSGLPVIYSKDTSGGLTNNQELYITPQYLRSCKASTSSNPLLDDWRVSRDGSAWFAARRARFNADGTFHLGGEKNAQTTTGKSDGYIDFDPLEGTLTIGGQNVVIDTVDTVQIGTTVANTLKNDSNFTGVIINSVGTLVIGDLETEDVSVGNGSCFFKGSSAAHDPSVLHGHSYGAGTAGAGHLANGNIWWDNEGNLNIGGQLRLKGTSLEWGGAVQEYVLHDDDFAPQGTDPHDQIYRSNEGLFYRTGALYHLPDPEDYLGREVFVSVSVSGEDLSDIFGRTTVNHSNNTISYWGGCLCMTLPCFDIDSTDADHKWIRWGIDACKYNTCEINHLPKFYQLGTINTYNGGNQYHQWGTSDSDAIYSFYNVSDITSHTYSGNTRSGLYLIPTDANVAKMRDEASKNSGNGSTDFVTLRMRCQAKKLANSDIYYWEIQTTDFMPCFDTGEYAETTPTETDSETHQPVVLHTSLSEYDLTAYGFYTYYESVIAGTSLSFEHEQLTV